MGYPRLKQWYRAERLRRTRAVADGTAPITWLDSGTRVSWSEIVSKARDLGITDDAVSMRRKFHEGESNADS